MIPVISEVLTVVLGLAVSVTSSTASLPRPISRGVARTYMNGSSGSIMDSTACSGGLLDSAKYVIVLDAVPTNDASANRVFTLNKRDVVWLANALHSKMTAGDLDALLHDSASALAKASSTRWLSKKAEKLYAVMIYLSGNTPVIRFNETARASRLETDLQSLIQVAAKAKAAAATTECVAKIYSLQQERANLNVTGLLSNSSDKSADTLKAAIVTGPREVVFLSANAGITKVSQVTYDQTSKALGPAQTPKSFYIAANWSLFEDLYIDQSAASYWPWSEVWETAKQLYVGAFVEGSTRPLNQAGAIVGFRWLPYVSDVLPLKSVSPFIGFVRARTDTIAAVTPQGPNVKTHFGPAKLIGGLSLNLSQALSWLGSTTSGSGKGGGS